MFVPLINLIYRARDKLSGDGGAVTLEWMVIAALLFAIAIAALALYTSVVRKYMGQIG